MGHTKRCAYVVALVLAAAGCGDGGGTGPDAGTPQVQDPAAAPFHYIADMPGGEAQRALLCAMDRDDRFVRWYCEGPTAPAIDGIDTIVSAVGIDIDDFAETTELERRDRFAAVAHSTALGPLSTTVLNPRIVLFSALDEPEFAAVAFKRGEFVAELAMEDVARDTINFYLVVYRLACLPSCSQADRHLERADSGWQQVSVYAETELQNTPLDCLRCHTPGGGDGPRILRMHELELPWSHWMVSGFGFELADQFRRSRPPGETYAGVAVDRFAGESAPDALESLLRAHSMADQPNQFDGLQIIVHSGATEPNAAWLDLYGAAIRGESIDAPPHWHGTVFDQQRVHDATGRYLRVASGEADEAEFPDVTRPLFGGEQALRYIGYKPAVGLSGAGIVRHMCGPCHDGRFPGISRDRFRIADFPNDITPALREKIAERLALPDDDPHKMPPVIAGELEPDEIDRVLGAMESPAEAP